MVKKGVFYYFFLQGRSSPRRTVAWSWEKVLRTISACVGECILTWTLFYRPGTPDLTFLKSLIFISPVHLRAQHKQTDSLKGDWTNLYHIRVIIRYCQFSQQATASCFAFEITPELFLNVTQPCFEGCVLLGMILSTEARKLTFQLMEISY